MKIVNLFSLLAFVYILLWACVSSDHRETVITSSPVKVIFDTDMGSDCDDAGALAVLHVLADRGEAEILACIYSSGTVPYGAGIIEAINIYYNRPDIPIGANYDPEVGDPHDKMDAEKLAKDTAAFKNRIVTNFDVPEQTHLNRKVLIDQEDNSVVYITVGHTKGLYDLMLSEPDDLSPLTGKELLEKKLNRWVALGALGAYNEGNYFVKDWNFFFNNTGSYTQYLVENFSMPVYFVDGGSSTMTGKSLMSTAPGNIVRTAYRDWLWNFNKLTLDDQRPSWDLAAVLFAVRGESDFFSIEQHGALEFDKQLGSRWNTKENNPNHYFVKQISGTNDSLAALLNEFIGLNPK